MRGEGIYRRSFIWCTPDTVEWNAIPTQLARLICHQVSTLVATINTVHWESFVQWTYCIWEKTGASWSPVPKHPSSTLLSPLLWWMGMTNDALWCPHIDLVVSVPKYKLVKGCINARVKCQRFQQDLAGPTSARQKKSPDDKWLCHFCSASWGFVVLTS